MTLEFPYAQSRIRLKRPLDDYHWDAVLPVEQRTKKTPRFSRGGGGPGKQELVCVIELLYDKLDTMALQHKKELAFIPKMERDIEWWANKKEALDKTVKANNKHISHMEQNIECLRRVAFLTEEYMEKDELRIKELEEEVGLLTLPLAGEGERIRELEKEVADLKADAEDSYNLRVRPLEKEVSDLIGVVTGWRIK